MAKMERVWAIKQFTFNSVTYDDANGGPRDWSLDDSNQEIEDRVADQIYPGQVIIPEGSVMLAITMRDPYTSITRGTKSDLVITMAKNDGTEYEVFTFADMVFVSQNASGQKSIPAQSALSFRYEGSGDYDGTGRISRA
jgi:hypothetical protein